MKFIVQPYGFQEPGDSGEHKAVSLIPRGTPEGLMDGWMDVGKPAQLGCTVTHYILLATPPQKAEASKDQPKPVSLNHNPNGIHLAIMCWIPNIMITDVLTARCPPFPTLVSRSSSKL